MTPVLVDSSAWIAGLVPQGPAAVREAVDECLYLETASVNGIVVVEVLQGARSKRQFEKLESLLALVTRLKVDEFTWHEAARLGFELGKRGLNVPASDLVIAASAVMNDCRLLHCDRHFEMIAEHAPLKTWYVAA